MINKEIIIFQIEDMLSNINKENLVLYGGYIDNGAAFLELITNILALLKEQEAEIRQLRLALDIAKGTCKGIKCGQFADMQTMQSAT